jgi:hypothetical protein
MADYGSWINDLSKRTGASVEQSDIDRLNNTNPDDVGRLQSALEDQYKRRGSSGQTGSGPDSGALSAAGVGSGRGEHASSGPSSNQAWTGSPGPSAGFGGGFGQWGNYANDLYHTLLDRSKQSLAVDANDPIIKAQVNSFRAGATRDMRHNVDALAEGGGPNANLGAERRMASESVAQGAGNLQSTLMGNELSARRNEIQNALTQMGGLLSDQQRLGLQQQLGLIDANLRQQQINSGNDQWSAEFGRGLANDANYWNRLYLGY